MESSSRPAAFWVIAAFLVFTIAFMLVGQTCALFDYEFTVRLGLQESRDLIGEYGVQVNRAFGLSDTLVYLPALVAALVGLVRRRPWALTALAVAAGVSLYWPVCCAGLVTFPRGVPGFQFVVHPAYWVIFALYVLFALWILWYVITRGEKLVSR
ncbi:MAG: hypothetical protein AB1646_23495 [Thermodesulfobacteriota bacterium]